MEPHWTANKALRILTRAWGNGLDFVLSGFNLPMLSCLQMSLTRFSPHFSFRAAHWHGLDHEGSHLTLLSCSLQHLFMFFFVIFKQLLACMWKSISFMCLRWGTWNFQLLAEVMWLWGSLLLHVLSRTRGASGSTPVPLLGEICRDLTHSKAREAQIKH